MIADSGASMVFVDEQAAMAMPAVEAKVIRLDQLDDWLGAEEDSLSPEEVGPDDPFNIIYSSGTTGTPKGIVQSHGMRWAQIKRLEGAGFADAVTLIATPLYSNTTLVSFLPTLAYGGTVIILGKFDARRYLEVAQRERATHTMLVPVQYQRIMADPEFDRFDLSAFRFKSCTSAPFSAELKADIVRRWPGQLLEIYGMTEGGGTCLLYANQHPGKLHTVGQPAPGNDIRLIDEEGREVQQGDIGEVVGRSPAMMIGYHGRPDATAGAQWEDEQGRRFIRHGDLGRFDPEGFLTLLGRSKDLIISGGFNIYPPDIEAVIADHPAVADCAVIGVPSEAWGETPVAFYVPRDADLQPAELVSWVNARVGKTQRLSGARAIAALPRSEIGKVLKRELRELWIA
jgi:acyl-CoA synthetase (AMP-forming)/AMP-acid ligase II